MEQSISTEVISSIARLRLWWHPINRYCVHKPLSYARWIQSPPPNSCLFKLRFNMCPGLRNNNVLPFLQVLVQKCGTLCFIKIAVHNRETEFCLASVGEWLRHRKSHEQMHGVSYYSNRTLQTDGRRNSQKCYIRVIASVFIRGLQKK
jgi:hypothetical protein